MNYILIVCAFLFVSIDILCFPISFEMTCFRFNRHSLAVEVLVQFYLQRMQLTVRLNSNQNLWFLSRLPARQRIFCINKQKRNFVERGDE